MITRRIIPKLTRPIPMRTKTIPMRTETIQMRTKAIPIRTKNIPMCTKSIPMRVLVLHQFTLCQPIFTQFSSSLPREFTQCNDLLFCLQNSNPRYSDPVYSNPVLLRD